MSFVEWNDNLLVGIKIVDEQHKHLFRIVNNLFDEVTACHSLDDESVITGKFMEQFQDYAALHFAAEEGILAENKYKALDQHRDEHDDFVRQLRLLRQSHAAGELALSFDVFKFASDWIAEHIKISDQKYVSSVKKNDSEH